MIPASAVKKNKMFLTAYGILLLIFTLISILIPPMQSPDESAHFARAYGISQGTLNLETPHTQQSGVRLDHNLIQFMELNLFNIQVPGYRIEPQLALALKKLPWSNQFEHYIAPGTGYSNPIVYFPQAVGIWIGRQLNLTIYKSYFIARFISCAAVLGLILFALYIYPTNPLTIGLLILPMSLFQIAMPTIDGITYALALFILCFFTSLQKTGAAISNGSAIALGVLICILITARMHTLPFLLLILFLPHTSSRKFNIALFSICALITLAWLGWAVSHTVDLRLNRSLSSAQIAQLYLHNPMQWLEVLQNTVSSSGIRDFYSKSFIGILGWLHIPMPIWYYPLSWILLGILSILSLDKTSRHHLFNALSWLFFLIALLSCFIILNALLLGWTPYPTLLIEGVQGRYFWIPACCLAFCLSRFSSFTKYSVAILSVFFILNLSLVAYVYFLRYN